MSEPGATDIVNIANAPLASLTPEQAGARYDSLKADSKFVERALAGGVDEQEMLRDLYQLARGHVPEHLRPPSNAGDVYEGMSLREIELDKQRVETYSKDIIGFNDEMRATIARGLATQQQHDQAVRELARLRSDPSFVHGFFALIGPIGMLEIDGSAGI
jgi:hypothetical protein